MDFTESDVMEELRDLGYDNVPREKLTEFMADLRHLMQHERSRSDADDLSLASSSCASVSFPVAAAADHDDSSDGLARYPQHTDFNWGGRSEREKQQQQQQQQRGSASNASTPRSAFEKSKIPLEDNSFYNESFNNGGDVDRREHRSRRAHDQEDDDTSPKRFINAAAADDSIASTASSTNSIVIKRKISRRDADGNRDISTEELTYLEGDDNDDDAATLAGDDVDEDLPLDDDDERVATTALPRRVVGRRPRSAGSESSNASSASSTSARAHLPSFIRPQPEVRRKRHDPVDRYHQYNEAWTAQRAPGEKQHKQIRWAVREHMQRREEIIAPVQRYYVPNNFVPPTDKKRQDLRWEIRTKLANKLNPSERATAFNVWM